MKKKNANMFKKWVHRNKFLTVIVSLLLFIILVSGILISTVFIIPFFEDKCIQLFSSTSLSNDQSNEKAVTSLDLSNTEKNIKRIQQKLISKTPIAAFMVVNTSANHFFLYKNRKLIREGLCSTGSYILLQTDDQQKWIFRTPRGEFRIRGKTTSPVWIKPDWAFIEDGLPVPAANDDSRYEYGVLGDYALSLGYGYMIHGTLYKRFLGMPVTHGCIRLDDADLKVVYTNLDIGSKVYIF